MENQSHTEVLPLKQDLFTAKTKTRIGCWNVKSLWSTGRLIQLRDIKIFGLSMLALNDIRWMDEANYCIVLSSGRQDDKLREGIGSLLSKESSEGLGTCKLKNIDCSLCDKLCKKSQQFSVSHQQTIRMNRSKTLSVKDCRASLTRSVNMTLLSSWQI